MRAPKTYFEQIPVKTVKEIAQELPENGAIESKSTTVETQDATSAPERWRELAQKVQHEQNPDKMIRLVQQLIATFDEEQQSKQLPPTRDKGNRSRSSEA